MRSINCLDSVDRCFVANNTFHPAHNMLFLLAWSAYMAPYWRARNGCRNASVAEGRSSGTKVNNVRTKSTNTSSTPVDVGVCRGRARNACVD